MSKYRIKAPKDYTDEEQVILIQEKTLPMVWKTIREIPFTRANVVDKIKEELDEVLVEVQRDDLSEQQKQARIEDELGDLLFANVNLVRHLQCNPEQVLRQANSKFEKGFRLVELEVLKQGKLMSDCTLDELEVIWQEIKKL